MDNDHGSAKLNRRELLAVQGVVAGMTKTEALIQAGYSLSVAQTRQQDVLGKPRVRLALAHALEKAGITDDIKARALVEGLKARREYQTREGVAMDGGPDHGTRLKYLKLAFELDGDLDRAEDSETSTFEAMVASLSAPHQLGEGMDE